MSLKIAVTGANGFVGKHLLEELVNFGAQITIYVRYTDEVSVPPGIDVVKAESLESIELQKDSADIFIHLAAIAHKKKVPETEYLNVNLNLTKELLAKCIEADVSRFFFVSTALVHGENAESPLTESSPTAPTTPYARIKLIAENEIIKLTQGTSTAYTIIRAPLIYGKGVKANFESLLNALKRGFPLPIRAIRNNKRSLLSVNNLCNFIVHSMTNSKADNEIFLVSDDSDLATSEMVSHLTKSLQVRNFTLPIPVFLLKSLAKLMRFDSAVGKMTDSFQLDISKSKRTLNWAPPKNSKQGFDNAFKDLM